MFLTWPVSLPVMDFSLFLCFPMKGQKKGFKAILDLASLGSLFTSASHTHLFHTHQLEPIRRHQTMASSSTSPAQCQGSCTIKNSFFHSAVSVCFNGVYPPSARFQKMGAQLEKCRTSWIMMREGAGAPCLMQMRFTVKPPHPPTPPPPPCVLQS